MALRDRTAPAEVVPLHGQAASPTSPADTAELSPLPALPPPDLHPARVYLASLSPGSRRTMRAALENVAALVSGGKANALTLPWHELRYQHTAAVRAALAERYTPATANKTLSALRGVVRECWRLGYISTWSSKRRRKPKATCSCRAG